MLFAVGCGAGPTPQGNEDVRSSSAALITYRNVFLERGKAQSAIDAKVNGVYNTYFSTTDANRLYYETGTDMAYVLNPSSPDIRSEGQSYGMMITVQMNDQAKFNKLWKFAYTNMRNSTSTHPNYRFYAWAVNTSGAKCDENSAPDGEEYFAMALYFAHYRWGSASGTVYNNYKYWADDIVDAMKNRGSITGSRKRLTETTDDGNPCTGSTTTSTVTVGPLFDSATKLIKFDPTTSNGAAFSDPSYHLPAFYDLFAAVGPAADSTWWTQAATAARTHLAASMNASTGLAPEYSNFDGSAHYVSWNSNSNKFAYDACRVGGNVGMDWQWTQKSTTLQARADTLINFFNGKGPTAYLNIWDLAGTSGSGYHTQALVGMNAVATLATTSAKATQAAAIVDDFWNMSPPTGTYRYYDGLLYTFGVLHMSGRYQAYVSSGSGGSGGSGSGGTGSGGTGSGGTGSGGTGSGGTGSGGTGSGGAGSGGAASGGAASGGAASGGAASGGSGTGGSGTGGAAMGGSSGGSEPCVPAQTVTGTQSGNFGTTGAYCFRTASTINGWGCSNLTGRTIKINGASVASCGALPMPARYNGYYYFDVSAGTVDYASIYWW